MDIVSCAWSGIVVEAASVAMVAEGRSVDTVVSEGSTGPSPESGILLVIDCDDKGRVLMVTLLVGVVAMVTSGERAGGAGLGGDWRSTKGGRSGVGWIALMPCGAETWKWLLSITLAFT